MADRLNTTVGNYHRLENREEGKLTIAQLKEIANALGIPLSNLLYDAIEKPIGELWKELHEKYQSKFNDVIATTEDIIKVQRSIKELAQKLKIGTIEYTDSKGVKHLLPIRDTKYDYMLGGLITTDRLKGQHFGLDEQDKEEILQVLNLIVRSINQDFNDGFYQEGDDRTYRDRSSDVDILQADNQRLETVLLRQEDKNIELALAKRKLEEENWELKEKLAACLANKKREEP